jgi:RimJ/RimL family protein N-acetyltransferase
MTPTEPRTEVLLREVSAADLPIFFEQQLDAEAIAMAAFTAADPSDRAAFDAHWARILADPTTLNRTIVCDGEVAGHVACFEQEGQREVTYWLGRRHWGRGLATRALAALLELAPERPLYARAVKDNLASLRVLEKCGFAIAGEDRGYANGRGAEVEEWILILPPGEPR